MNQHFLRPFMFLVLCACVPFFGRAQSPRHVVLISIDGMRPDFYLDPSWPAPNLQTLKKEGLYADFVRPVFPSVTYPNHVSMITGALPARHGVYGNTPFEPLGATGRWNWQASLIRVPTIFDLVHKAGLTSAAIDWPVTIGAPIDYNIPEIWAVDTTQNSAELVKAVTTPPGLWQEIEQNATGKILGEDINSEYLNSDENSGRMAAYIIRKYKPTLVALHLACVDHAQHAWGRQGMGVAVAVAAVDRVIGEVLEALEKAGIRESTAVVVTGDHGFVDIHSTLFPNVWLKRAGLLGTGKSWRVKFQSVSGAAYLYLQEKNDSVTARAVRRVLEGLPSQERRLFTLLDRHALDGLGADSSALLAISPLPGIAVGGSGEGALLRPAMQGGTHGYLADFPQIMTGFVGWGAGLHKGTVIPEMRMPDIAPVILALLGIPFQTPDGVLFPGIIDPVRNSGK